MIYLLVLSQPVFRSNSLGTCALVQYMNMVCSEWRQKCCRRVFEEAAKGQSVTPVTTNATPPTVVLSSKGVKFIAGGQSSVSSSSDIVCDHSSSSSGGVPASGSSSTGSHIV